MGLCDLKKQLRSVVKWEKWKFKVLSCLHNIFSILPHLVACLLLNSLKGEHILEPFTDLILFSNLRCWQ